MSYTVNTISKESRPGCWSVLTVEILKDGEKIGEYERNYSSLYNTFVPFSQGGKEYALYSRNYTATSVMELPSCKEIASEETSASGFCPTGFYVPQSELVGEHDIIGPDGQFGFVCGCVWGDDSSWKIQFLDLTRITEGIITRDERFGYLELLGSADTLRDAIEVDEFTQEEFDSGRVCIKIACAKWFKLKPEDKR